MEKNVNAHIDREYEKVPKYLLVGVKPEEMRRLPVRYEVVHKVLYSDQERDNELRLKYYTAATIYNIDAGNCIRYSKDELEQMKQKSKEDTEKALYEQLKKKYDKESEN